MSFYPLSESELRDWAYRPESFLGFGQDADLWVASLHNADVILELASDDDCPTQRDRLRDRGCQMGPFE